MTRLVLVLTHLIAAGAGAAMAWWWQDRRARPWQVQLPPVWDGQAPSRAQVARAAARSRATVLAAMPLDEHERAVLAAAHRVQRRLWRRGRLGAALRACGYRTLGEVQRAAGVPRDVARRALHGDRVRDLPAGAVYALEELVTGEYPAVPAAEPDGGWAHDLT